MPVFIFGPQVWSSHTNINITALSYTKWAEWSHTYHARRRGEYRCPRTDNSPTGRDGSYCPTEKIDPYRWAWYRLSQATDGNYYAHFHLSDSDTPPPFNETSVDGGNTNPPELNHGWYYQGSIYSLNADLNMSNLERIGFVQKTVNRVNNDPNVYESSFGVKYFSLEMAIPPSPPPP